MYAAGLEPSGNKLTLDSNQHSYADYINMTRRLISASRVDLDHLPATTIIDSNAAYELTPDHTPTAGVILIHGLYDSAFITRDFAEFLRQQGLLVRGLLLPGHGTRPGDLLNVQLEEWHDVVRFAATDLRKTVDRLYLGGFSTGAALAIHHAAHDNNIQGIFAFAPAFKINNPLEGLLDYTEYLCMVSSQFAWLPFRQLCYDYTKYTDLAMNGGKQVRRLTKQLQHLQHNHTLAIPHFVVVAEDDEVVATSDTLRYFNGLQTDNKRLLIYRREVKHDLGEHIHEYSSVYPQQHIIDFSHQSLITSIDNRHYGRTGDFQAARLQALQQQNPTLCAADLFYGALSPKNYNKANLLQLTYNPDFAELCQQAKIFIASTLQN